jgi:hypothetical protein
MLRSTSAVLAATLLLCSATAMAQQTPRGTVQALYDAVHAHDWTRAGELADTESLTAWYLEERAKLANLLVRPGERTRPFESSDINLVTDILNRYAEAPVRIANIGALGAISSLGEADLFRRQFEVMEELFGPATAADRPVPFRVLDEVPVDTGKVNVFYEGYIGIGGGLPDHLEVIRHGGRWFYVLIPELLSPDLALVIGTTTSFRDR